MKGIIGLILFGVIAFVVGVGFFAGQKIGARA